MKKTTLVLFDIDGTILTTGGAGETALRLGFLEQFGIHDDLKNVEIAGRTDSGIAIQMLRNHGIAHTPENIDRFYSGYLSHLERELGARQGRVFPGITELIAQLEQTPHIALALLTGNLERGARLKLRHYGLESHFPFGAFADDHADRNQLGHFAMRRAHQHHGVEFRSEDIYILGDTPHDITCARAIGAKAIAVATGSFTADQLSAHQPDAVFENFSSTGEVLHTIAG